MPQGDYFKLTGPGVVEECFRFYMLVKVLNCKFPCVFVWFHPGCDESLSGTVCDEFTGAAADIKEGVPATVSFDQFEFPLDRKISDIAIKEVDECPVLCIMRYILVRFVIF